MADIVSQVEELFSDREQWTSFLELVPQSRNIQNSWWQTIQPLMTKCFKTNNHMEGWGFVSWGLWDYKWYLTDLGDKSVNSFCLWIKEWYGNYSLALWADRNQHDLSELSRLLDDVAYSPIISAFESPNCSFGSDSDIKLIDQGDYVFGGLKVAPRMDYLAWYAHYKPEELVSQILEKVDRIRKNAVVTDLLRRINRETLKQS